MMQVPSPVYTLYASENKGTSHCSNMVNDYRLEINLTHIEI